MKTKVDLPTAEVTDQIAAYDLITALESDPRFRRDSALGGIFHPGRISFREISPVDSVHVVIRGDRVSVHVDDVSPLVIRADGTSGYAWGRVVAHNLAVLVGDVSRRARGLSGRQRCNLRCEAVDDDGNAAG